MVVFQYTVRQSLLEKKLVGTEEKEYWEKIGETFLGKNKMLNLGYSCMCTLFMS